jgi:glutamine synthetase
MIRQTSFTKDDIRKFAEEENVRYLRLQFTDILGTIKNVEVPVSQLEKVLDNEMFYKHHKLNVQLYLVQQSMGRLPKYLNLDVSTYLILR